MRYMLPFVGLVFLGSAIAKILDFIRTARFLTEVLYLSLTASKTLLALLVLFELVLSFLLLFGYHPRIAYGSAIGLLVLFTLFSFYLLKGGYDNCRCFGSSISVQPLTSVAKNLVLTLILIITRRLQGVDNLQVEKSIYD